MTVVYIVQKLSVVLALSLYFFRKHVTVVYIVQKVSVVLALSLYLSGST